MKTRPHHAAVLAGALILTVAPRSAHGAGLYFSERGVRPLGRGGAFTAGADDLGAIWYNPAGVYDAGSQFLFDASWLHFTNDYTRRALLKQRDPNTGEVVSVHEQTFDTVNGSSPVIPIPTLAGSYQVHRDWVIALGAEAPYAAIASYPEAINGVPAPQRYSLITLEGSALAVVGFWAGFKPHEKWRIGAGLQLLVGKFATTAVASGCVPDKFFCAPEQPEWDVLTQLSVGPIVTPSGNVGVKFMPTPKWTIGAAFQAPFFVRAGGEETARMPKTPAFETAVQEGQDVTVSFELPWSARLGVEYRPIERLDVELDVSVEGWSMHDAITVENDNVVLRNVVGFPDPFKLPTQTIPRNFTEAFSVRLGGEYGIPVSDYLLDVRGGVSFESSAVPPEYLSVLTVDMPKVTLGLGGSLHVGKWRFDAVYAHIFGIPVDVDPATAASPILSPVEANRAEPHTVNGGYYDAAGNVVGIGLTYQFSEGARGKGQGAREEEEAEGPSGKGQGAMEEGEEEGQGE